MSRYKKLKGNWFHITNDVGCFTIIADDKKWKSLSTSLAVGLNESTKSSVALFNLDEERIIEANDYAEYILETKEKIYIDENTDTDINCIEEKCRELKEENNLEIVMIDSYTKTIPDNIEISKRLKKLSNELNIMIVVITPYPKTLKINKIPTIEDLSYKELVEFADTIYLDYYTKKGKSIHVAKNNYGDTGIVNY